MWCYVGFFDSQVALLKANVDLIEAGWRNQFQVMAAIDARVRLVEMGGCGGKSKGGKGAV